MRLDVRDDHEYEHWQVFDASRCLVLRDIVWVDTTGEWCDGDGVVCRGAVKLDTQRKSVMVNSQQHNEVRDGELQQQAA